MQHSPHIDSRAAQRSAPTYLASYIFPVLLLAFEVYRVGYWMASRGIEFSHFGESSRGPSLMLAMFAVQLLAEGVFLAAAWVARQSDLQHRFTTVFLGLFGSLLILAFDYGLSIAF